MRYLRWFLGSLGVLLLLVVALVGGAWIWAGSEGSARWALGELARRGVPIKAEGVQGSLRGGLRVERLAWAQDGLSVEARAVQLGWQPLLLLHRKLQIDLLQAASVRIEDKRPKTDRKPQPPTSLALPLQVAVDQLQVGSVDYVGATTVQVLDLQAAYGFDGARHDLAVRNARAWNGHYRGEVHLDAEGAMALRASVQGRIAAPVPGVQRPLDLVFEASASGPLAGFDLHARIDSAPGSPGSGVTHADASARVTPWAAVPVASARADLQGLDIGALWSQAPRTVLAGQVQVQPSGPGAWRFSVDLRNTLAGPWDRQRVPVSRLRAEGDWRLPRRVLVRDLEAQVGGGRVVARGEWEGEDAWKVDGTLTGIDPAAVHSAMASVPVSGRATLRGQGTAISFDTELAATGAAKGNAGSAVAAAVGALELRSLAARGRWAGQELSLPQLVIRTADAKLDAGLELHPSTRSGRGRADLEAPGLRVRAVGSLASTAGGGNVRITASDIGQAQHWLERLPAMPDVVTAKLFAGNGDLQLAWQGGWDDPTVQATLTLPTLQDAAPQPAWVVRDLTAKLDGRLADARLDLKARAQAGARDATVEVAARGGRRGADAWQGEIGSLAVAVRDAALGPGPWRLNLRQRVEWRWADGQLDTGRGEAALVAPVAKGPSQALIAWEPVHWRSGELRTAGHVNGLPLAWAELFGGGQLAGSALTGDLVFDAQWDAQLGRVLRLRAELARRSGDVSVLAETLDGAATRVQAGVREARVTVQSEGEAVTATLRWDSERAGTADARVTTHLAHDAGGWSWPEEAPLSGTLRAQLPRLGVWSLLAPPGWRLRGSLAADVSIAGTRADPALAGTLSADDLALRSVVDGVALQDGELRARLDGRRLVVETLRMRGAGENGGTVSGSGEGGWTREGLQVRVAATLDHLRASSRSDREITVSGQVTASVDGAGAQVRGALHVDQARIRLPDDSAPKLGDDVVVRNLPPGVTLNANAALPGEAPAAKSGRPVDLNVTLDLGNDLRVQGRGISTRLVGTLTITGQSLTEPRLVGTVRAIGGEYQAYGQQLEIERAVLRFTGAIDNPSLDVLAIRPRLAQRVGVQVTGTAQSPFVTLYSEPDLTEAEKLSWLVLGRASASGGAETALLQQAAVALLASRSGRGGDGKGIAGLVGLDQLSVSRQGAEGPAVTLGKRLGQNLYAAYERSLAGAVGTLYVYYDLSRRVTVRAQAGERSALDLIFTFAYD
ncbi:translocation/assembly module TamB domain-containing protein [Ramlibacter sp. MMS24-I3-19]|uniref:translocation/assembly module TamB domain-containing protein n=1 Tax=Ramlibacter sp. MMS24-I3-19 TaxID=3416606 RepID=UPI003D070A65